MPFIDIRTTRTVPAAKSEALKSRIGGIIDIIPEKSEAVLMIDINDKCNLFFGGKRQECCYMAVNLHHEAPMENKKELIEKLFVIVASELEIEQDNIFITISEFPYWGAGGQYI